MSQTYRATLLHDRLQWRETGPVQDQPIDVYVTLIGPADSMRNGGRAMAEALQEIANRGGLHEVPDAVEWQRDIRADRAIRGRPG